MKTGNHSPILKLLQLLTVFSTSLFLKAPEDAMVIIEKIWLKKVIKSPTNYALFVSIFALCYSIYGLL